MVQPAIEAPARKPWAMSVWGIALLVVFALIIFGGIGAWVLSQREEAPLALSTPVSSEAAVETTAQSQTSSVSGEKWRTLDFVIPSETLWREGENSYTTIAKPTQDTIAWSNEIIEGEFILSAQVTSERPDGIAHFIVYGDGVGFLKGCLIFTYQTGERFLPAFQKINPEFSRDWVKKTWVFKTNYAQPVPLVDHSRNIPPSKRPSRDCISRR